MARQSRHNAPSLHAAITIEDHLVLRCIVVRKSGPQLTVIHDQAAQGAANIPALVREHLRHVMIDPSHKLATIGISTPGTIDAGRTLRDLPREGSKAVPDQLSILHFRSELANWMDEGSRIVVNNDTVMAALGERWHRTGNRAATREDDFAYIRAGTGINGLAFVNAEPATGVQHPEMGHMRVHIHPHDLAPAGARFRSVCTSHSDCLEGRGGSARLRELATHYGGWSEVDAISGSYIAQLCHVLALVLAPRRIVIGGTTIEEAAARGGKPLHHIHTSFDELMNGYPRNAVFGDRKHTQRFIERAALPVAEASWRGALWAAMKPPDAHALEL